jgi:hypothetical protein
MFKLIVAGSRHWHDFDFVAGYLDEWLQTRFDRGIAIEIVSGGAKGVDALGERYAKEKGWPVHPVPRLFPADWDGPLGKGAGPARNREMSLYADALAAFPDPGRSPGTRNMIALMKRAGKPVREQVLPI